MSGRRSAGGGGVVGAVRAERCGTKKPLAVRLEAVCV